MAITKETIWAAADEIDAVGHNPTLAAVRKAVGAGSYTTIQEAMTEWKARRAAKERPLREPAPSVVAERLAELGAEIWSVALEMADSRLTTERAALAVERANLEAARQEAADLADSLTVELEEARGRLSVVEAERDAAREDGERVRAELVAKGSIVIDLTAQLDAAKKALERVEAERDAAREDAAKAREQAAILTGKLEALERQNAALLERLPLK
jgi:chromosome segregation ATPase